MFASANRAGEWRGGESFRISYTIALQQPNRASP